MLSILYDRIRETKNDYVVTHSFSTTAIYILAKDLMEQWGYTTLAGKARKELVDLIFKGRSGSDGWETVEEMLRRTTMLVVGGTHILKLWEVMVVSFSCHGSQISV